MTIYWSPVEDGTNPDTIDVWHVTKDGKEEYIDAVDVSNTSGMPDVVGGLAPDAVRVRMADYYQKQQKAEVLRDHMAMDYERGAPP